MSEESPEGEDWPGASPITSGKESGSEGWMGIHRGPGGRSRQRRDWLHQAAVFSRSEPDFSFGKASAFPPWCRIAKINLGDSGELVSRRCGLARALPPGPGQSPRIDWPKNKVKLVRGCSGEAENFCSNLKMVVHDLNFLTKKFFLSILSQKKSEAHSKIRSVVFFIH